MKEMVQSRRTSGKRELKDDLLTSFLGASEGDFDVYEKLSDSEVLGMDQQTHPIWPGGNSDDRKI